MTLNINREENSPNIEWGGGNYSSSSDWMTRIQDNMGHVLGCDENDNGQNIKIESLSEGCSLYLSRELVFQKCSYQMQCYMPFALSFLLFIWDIPEKTASLMSHSTACSVRHWLTSAELSMISYNSHDNHLPRAKSPRLDFDLYNFLVLNTSNKNKIFF